MTRIFMINEYATTPDTGYGGRTHYLSRELARLGHDVTVIAARHHHLLREAQNAPGLPTEEAVEGYRFLRIPVPTYKHAHDKRRILAWFAFACRIARLDIKALGRPDVILYSSPSLVGFLGAERLARRCGARLVFEVRDIWPSVLVEVGGYSQGNPFIRFLQSIEDRAYSRSDRVVSNIEGAVEHMVERGLDRNKFAWVPNGVALDEVENPEPLSPDMSAKIPLEGLRVVFTGTLGAANALETLIDAAALLRDKPEVNFLLVGQGRSRADLEKRAGELGLQNVHFLGPVPKAQVQSILAACDLCFIGWRDRPIFRWGSGWLKLSEYLFSGKPILHAFSGGYDPVSRFDAGITVVAENPRAVAEAIRRVLAMPEVERRRMGENGRRAALEHYEYGMLARRLEAVLIGAQLIMGVGAGDTPVAQGAVGTCE